MSQERRCDKCGSMASVSREKKLMTIICPQCFHKVVKNIVRKGAGG